MQRRSVVGEWLWRSTHRGVGLGDLLGSIGGNAVTAWIHLAPAWQSSLKDLVWQIPVFGLAGGMAWRLIVTPFEMIKEARNERDSARGNLAMISEARPFLWVGFSVGWTWIDEEDEAPAITAITLAHENRGSWVLCYNVENPWIEVLDHHIDLKVIKRDTLIAAHTVGTFRFQLPKPIKVTSEQFPLLVRVNADYWYDTKPPTRARLHGATMYSFLHGWKTDSKVDGFYFDVQREE